MPKMVENDFELYLITNFNEILILKKKIIWILRFPKIPVFCVCLYLRYDHWSALLYRLQNF
jgi:hypothetical protein